MPIKINIYSNSDHLNSQEKCISFMKTPFFLIHFFFLMKHVLLIRNMLRCQKELIFYTMAMNKIRLCICILRDKSVSF